MTGADDPDADRKYGPDTVARGPGGRFGQGNAGRPRGSRNKASLAAEVVLERGARAVARKAVELAKGGDVTAIRLVLERLVPPRRALPVEIDLPAVQGLADHPAAIAALVEAATTGAISPADAEALARLLGQHREALAVADLDARIARLEDRQGRGG